MSQPPYYNFNQPQSYRQQQPYQQPYQQQQYQQHSYQQPSPQQHMMMMQQHQLLPQQQPFLMQQPSMQQTTQPSKQPHWFDQMCEVISTQQSRHEAGSLDTPPMLTPGNYVQWSSRFLRFIELKKPHGRFMKKIILEGPYKWPTTTVAGDARMLIPQDLMLFL